MASMSNVRVRGYDVGVLVTVWDWSEADFARNDALVDQVIAYVKGGYRAGLTADDIMDDIMGRFGAHFEDIDIEISNDDEVTVTLVPVGLP